MKLIKVSNTRLWLKHIYLDQNFNLTFNFFRYRNGGSFVRSSRTWSRTTISVRSFASTQRGSTVKPTLCFPHEFSFMPSNLPAIRKDWTIAYATISNLPGPRSRNVSEFLNYCIVFYLELVLRRTLWNLRGKSKGGNRDIGWTCVGHNNIYIHTL